jgi:hypothetical protein
VKLMWLDNEGKPDVDIRKIHVPSRPLVGAGFPRFGRE